jgi:hypothetical protein
MKREFTPRSFEEFAGWIRSEIGHITIEELMVIYKKITEKKKSTEKTTNTEKK